MKKLNIFVITSLLISTSVFATQKLEQNELIESEISRIESLSQEVLEHIMDYLDVKSLFNLSETCQSLARSSDRLRFFEKTLEADRKSKSNCVDSLQNRYMDHLADSCFKRGDYKGAIPIFQQMVQMDYSNGARALAYIYARGYPEYDIPRNKELAMSYHQQALDLIQRQYENHGPHIRKGLTEEHIKDFQQALDYCPEEEFMDTSDNL